MTDVNRFYEGLRQARAVYDFTTGDDNMFFDRIVKSEDVLNCVVKTFQIIMLVIAKIFVAGI